MDSISTLFGSSQSLRSEVGESRSYGEIHFDINNCF